MLIEQIYMILSFLLLLAFGFLLLLAFGLLSMAPNEIFSLLSRVVILATSVVGGVIVLSPYINS